MRTNPLSNTLHLLSQPAWTTAVFGFLLIATVAIAAIFWKRDSRRCTIPHLLSWVFRLPIGAMWWQQSATDWAWTLSSSACAAN